MTQNEIASTLAQHPKLAGALTGALLLATQAGSAAAQLGACNPGP